MKGDQKVQVVKAMNELGSFTAHQLSDKTGISVKRLSIYLVHGQKQCFLTMDGRKVYTVCSGGFTEHDLKISVKRSSNGTKKLPKPIELSVLKERATDLPEYVKFLEDELIRERRDHADLRAWVQRTLSRFPDPKSYRIPMGVRL